MTRIINSTAVHGGVVTPKGTSEVRRGGLNGRTVLNGVGAPAPALGADDDFYIDTGAWEIYGPKSSGQWGSGVPLIAGGGGGGQGPPGADGKTVLNGASAPSGGLGSDGDFYIRTSNWTIYGPKASGQWGAPTSIVGPAGTPGTPGAPGATGPAGPPVLHGSGAPGGGVGSNGDFYLDTVVYDLYGPKSGGTWGSPTSLVGPQGPPGGGGGGSYTAGDGLVLVGNEFKADFGLAAKKVVEGNSPRLLPSSAGAADGHVLGMVNGSTAWGRVVPANLDINEQGYDDTDGQILLAYEYTGQGEPIGFEEIRVADLPGAAGPEPWQTVDGDSENGWENGFADGAPVKYRIEQGDVLRLAGIVDTGGAADSTIAWTFPQGSRFIPPEPVLKWINGLDNDTSDPAPVLLGIGLNNPGEVMFIFGDADLIPLSGITLELS